MINSYFIILGFIEDKDVVIPDDLSCNLKILNEAKQVKPGMLNFSYIK